jgi:hypothetical protein
MLYDGLSQGTIEMVLPPPPDKLYGYGKKNASVVLPI